MMSVFGKLNRSHSESELHKLNLDNLCIQECLPPANFERNAPLVKKTIVIVQEVYHSSPIISRLGQSVPNHLHEIEKVHHNNLSMLSRTIIADTACVRSNSEIYRKNDYDNCDEIVPMDIDAACNNSETEKHLGAIEKMDIDPDCDNYKIQRLSSLDAALKKRKLKNESILLPEKEYLKSRTQINPILHKKNDLRYNPIILVALFCLTLLCFGLWYFQDDLIFVNHDVQLENLERDLLGQVYGQKGPVGVVIRSLESRSRWPRKIKVLGFIGPSGVGKTFIANILKKHFYPGLVYELYGVELDFRYQWESILSRLKSCCLNLVIIEDLNKKDSATLFQLIHSLPENLYILIISIFSIQYSDDELNYFINYNDINEIRIEFDNSNLFHELAVFNQFDMRQVKDWLEMQLKVQNIPISEQLLDGLLCNHNATYAGLKGLQSKLLLELEIKN